MIANGTQYPSASRSTDPRAIRLTTRRSVMAKHTNERKPMNTKKHNGWTNYATWRVALEIFGDDFSEYGEVAADDCEDYAKLIIDNGSSEGFALDYAYAFLAEVNWHEIAENLNETFNSKE